MQSAGSCCWYYKGTNFQANHNPMKLTLSLLTVVADTTKVRIFKQITTRNKIGIIGIPLLLILQRYEFSSKSQLVSMIHTYHVVVADTTKVRIFKQITTITLFLRARISLLLILQRYEFSSKSQRLSPWWKWSWRCCWYYKGTNFQANHNRIWHAGLSEAVVADTTKVRIFKQITTSLVKFETGSCCCWYYKGTNFQANHNTRFVNKNSIIVVADTTKVRIFKQITTWIGYFCSTSSCCWYYKGTNFQANHNRSCIDYNLNRVVADTTKVRIFKQITTVHEQ